uniref:Uncharacterized protein n=1 Tax=Davidia involucrata TaxID=16924 RepID=A0A5B7BAT0_DAVIN
MLLQMSAFHICRTTLALRLKASRESPGLTQELTNRKQKSVAGNQTGCDLFNEMKHRFLSFKKHKYLYGANNSGLMLFTFKEQLFSPFLQKKISINVRYILNRENLECYQNLAKSQAPKVIMDFLFGVINPFLPM